MVTHLPVTLIAMVLAGAVLPLQFALNAGLVRSAGGTAIWAAMVSLFFSFLCMSALLLMTRQAVPSLQALKSVPLLFWFGGLGGAIFVASSTFAIPRIGAASCVTLALFGQLFMSALIDHFGLFGLQAQEISLQRLAGIGLVLAGIMVLR